ncbi:hypothetical protein N8I77_010702 [Diaporthe amygdali]|uniref:Xylanolytic transcriptional activator regulatory domain-containing protein n=1 Tax=Phomopsis amygdali TaxID=1214568 RepID=A0AAD9S7V8_PHOAM|nr:hypothetical protein N8I77_010702 [Diaporthe amygdali]
MLLSQDGFDSALFPSMGSIPGAGSPVVFGPSWDFGNSPDELEHFFNSASGVFGPFLPFASPSQFDMEPPTPVVTNASNEDATMREAEPKLQVDASTLKRHICPDPEPVAQTSSRAVDETVDNDLWALPKDVEHWTMLQCCPTPSSVCPGRATAHLSFLEESSCSHRSARTWSLRPWTHGSAAPACVSNVSLSALTRERLSAITQSFFPKALEMHGLGSTSTSASSPHRRASDWFGSSGFILLPPTADLDLFLETYIGCVEPFFPLVPTRTLDPNELLGASDNEKGATLLLLLMMAIGASCNPAPSARRLGAGLAEVCRIALTDLVEKDNQYSTVPLILQCSLLLTIQSCWGGEKWQMDIGAGHRFMYIAMLRNSGYFQNVAPKRLHGRVAVDKHLNIHRAWRNWVEQEGRRRQVTSGVSEGRLAYDWVMLDQELSLFYDQPPTFAITELRAPLPEIDALWHAENAAEWGALYDSEKSSRPQYSLRRLFQLCLANDIDPAAYHLTPTRLRLLLYPIQSLVFHHGQLLDAVPDRQIPALSSFKTTTRTSSLLRLEELQSLLQTWWTLAEQHQHEDLNPTCDPAQVPAPPPSDSDQVLSRANTLLFHLISLQLHTDLKAIESFARGEDLSCSGGSSSATDTASLRTRHRLLAAQCVFAPPEAVYHAGQVLRLVRATALARRPPWWAAAVYRAALVLWAYASMQQCLSSSCEEGGGASQPVLLVAIDAVLPGDPALGRFLRQGRGVPVLSNGGAATVRVDREPQRVLGACVAVLGAGEACTWFAMGVRIKLEMLLQAWSGLGHGAV